MLMLSALTAVNGSGNLNSLTRSGWTRTAASGVSRVTGRDAVDFDVQVQATSSVVLLG
jgi:hypothetical protein